MSVRTILKVIPPLLVLAVGLAGFVLLRNMRNTPPMVDTTPPAPLVTTEEVVPAQTSMRITVDGEIVPIREITLSAEIAGRIDAKSAACDSGTYVRQGELLLEIDPRDYQLEVRRLQQMVKQAEVSIEETDVEHDNTQSLIQLSEDELQLTKNEVARFEELISRRAISESERDVALRSEIVARNALQTLQNQLRLLETRRHRLLQDKARALTELEKATLNLGRTRIESPLAGMVVADLVEQDDYVSPGTLLVRLEDLSQAEVRFNLRMEQLRWLWATGGSETVSPVGQSYRLPEMPLTVTLEMDGVRYAWDGRLSRYEGQGINVATRTIPCLAIIPEPRRGRLVVEGEGVLPGPPALMRGMYVTVTIDVPHQLSVLEVSASALRPGGNVWVADGGRLAIRHVRVIDVDDTKVRVVANGSQLTSGEAVITSPLPMPVDGMQIRTTAEPVAMVASKDPAPGSSGQEPAVTSDAARNGTGAAGHTTAAP